MVRMLLELDGHRVIEAKDGTSAWDLIQSHKPAVQLCRRVKDELVSIRVIVYTAGMASREDSISAGCDAYFLKTDPLPNLRDAVRRFYDLG